MTPDFLKLAEVDWTEAGQPVSTRFGDVYFSREDGLAESRAVFLRGCGLPEAWRGRKHFTVAELGFGTGLNILALVDLWVRERPAGGHLHIWSVEAHPLWADALTASHAGWPELAEISRVLRSRWPKLVEGLHRIDLPEFHATLDLALGDAAPMLESWSGRADAWFLDGFAPATNPAMWSNEVLSLVAARSAPGARAATFTVAGQVRRGLASGGFEVNKQPGHGRKRERLEAVFPGEAIEPTRPQHVAIIGGGIAGASLVRAFSRLGLTPTLIEADRPGAGASGAPAALVTPWIDAGLSPTAVLAAQAFRRASLLYRSEVPDAMIRTGVLRLSRNDADMTRLIHIAGQPVWPGGSLSDLDGPGIAALTGEDAATPGLLLEEGLVIEPRLILEAWLDGSRCLQGRVVSVEPGAPVIVRLDDGRSLEFDSVVIAAGWGSSNFEVGPLKPVRGQLIWCDGVDPGWGAVWGPGYAVPTRAGVLVGATHDRGRTDVGINPDDTRQLLARLATDRPRLAARLREVTTSARAAVRATTPDHRPLCGQMADGVGVLTGLGGRGFAWAPILAEHLAAVACATPSPLSLGHHDLIAPARFAAGPAKGAA